MARSVRRGKAETRKILNLPWYWWIIIPLVLIVLFDLMLRLGIKGYAFAALDTYDADTLFRNASYGLDGSMRVHDVEMVPYDSDGSEAPIRIREVRLETPGFFWVVRQALPSVSFKPFQSRRANRAAERLLGGEDGGYAYPPAHTMALQLSGVDFGDYGMHYFNPETNWFGSYTGALFEAEGCEAWWWNLSELEDSIGVDTGTRDIRIEYQALGEKTLRQRLQFGGPTMSELTIEIDHELPGPAVQFIDQLDQEWRMRKLSWTVRDHGFIAKRNAWCAKSAGIGEDEFIRRHLASVSRFLQMDGMIANPEALAVYEQYARNGGELVWETATTSSGEVGGSQAQTLAGFIAASGSTLRHGERVAYAMPTAIPPRDWPEGDFDSVWAILMYESGGTIASPVASEASTAQSAATLAPSQPEALAAAPAVAETTAPEVAATPPVPQVAATSTTDPAVDVQSPPPTPGVPTIQSVDVAYLAAPPRRRAEPERLSFDSLRVGQRVQVTIEGNRALKGEITSIDAVQLVLRVRMGGGYAQMALARTRIAKITRP